MARRCVLAGLRPYDSRAIKQDNISSVNMVCQFTFNLYFHCCYRCCYMYIVVVNKDVNSDCLFFSAFQDLQSIRDDEATTSKELFFVNALTDVPITSQRTRVEVANSGKTMTFYESIRAFQKISENFRFRSFILPIIRKDSCGPWHVE